MTSPPAILTLAADTVAPQPWRNGGGQTRELLAWPSPADWRLRISRADIAASGPFSAYADTERWFVVLSGAGVVLHMPTPDGHTRDHVLLPGHTPLQFDGAQAPGCTLLDGPTQDLNLMARGGQACMLPVEAQAAWQVDHPQAGLYTTGPGVWSDGLQQRALAAHTLLWQAHARHAASTAWRFQPDTDAPAWWLGFDPEAAP